ncbi:MAG: hypothetical protein JJU00_05940 [Opitutales bacterium]|nr:hypothetical protein [Opitutales bacterium]
MKTRLNPLILRYASARLRPRPLIFRLLATLIVVSFAFFMTFLLAREQADLDTVAAARGTLIPLIFIQGILLMLMGTGAVASGITQEKLDGVLDYQRMTPMPAWKKVLGYLFGLPVREYAMFAVTLPFLAYALIRGAVPFGAWAPFYLLFFSGVWLYHMTGFAAAMITRRWRWAARITQGMVLVLYLFLPQLSHLGIVFFEYLTVRPALAQFILPLLRGGVEAYPELLARLGDRDVPFFQWGISSAVFALILQGALIALFYRMIERKWNRESAPALGKISGSVAFFAVIFTALGNLWPRVTTIGESGPAGDIAALVAVPLVFGLLGLFAGLLILRVICPERMDFRRGLLRQRKFGWTRLPWWYDETSARACTVAFAVVLAGVLYFMQRTLYGRMGGSALDFDFSAVPLWFLPLVCGLTLVYFHSTREYLGDKNQLLLGLLVWIAPILLGLVLTAASLELRTAAYFLFALSPWGLTILGGTAPLALVTGEAAEDLARLAQARMFGLIAMLALTLYFQARLWLWQTRAHKELSGSG